jgi:hypothetical protein
MNRDLSLKMEISRFLAAKLNSKFHGLSRYMQSISIPHALQLIFASAIDS